MSLTFLAAWAVFSTDACRMFPQCVLFVIFGRMNIWLVWWWQKPTLDIEQGLLFALWLSQSCWGQGLQHSCCCISRSISELWCEIGRTRVVGGATEYTSSFRTVHQRVHSMEPPLTCDMGSQSAQFHLNCGNAAGPGVPLELYSQSHQHRSVGAAPPKTGTRIAVVVHLDLPCERWKQPRPSPTPACMCLPAKPTAANVRTAQAMGAPTVRSDVLQHWVYRGTSGWVVNLWITQPWRDGSVSALLPPSCSTCKSTPISAPLPHVGNPVALAHSQSSQR